MTVAVVDPDETVRQLLMGRVKELDDAPAGFESLDGFSEQWDPGEPVVVVVGPSRPPQELIVQAQQLKVEKPAVGMVMVVSELAPDILQQALRSGVDDVVAASVEEVELAEAVSRVSTRIVARRHTASVHSLGVPTGDPDGAEGKVVTVFCTKGGVGKSVIAVNLALALLQRGDGPVALVDADLQFGDVALMLGLQPDHTMAEVVIAGERLDGDLLSHLVLTHESGLRVLAAPTEPGSADHIHGSDLTRVLSVLRKECAYVIVDTSAHFSEITLAALQAADEILVVAGLDVMSLKAAKVGLASMRVLVPFSAVTFALNRANTMVGLSNDDAERVLERKIDVALPSDIVVAASVNKGVPVVIGSPKSKFAKGIGELAAKLSSPVRASAVA